MTPFTRAPALLPSGVLRYGRPVLALALIATLAACGGSPTRHASTGVVQSGGAWNRPASYDPPGPANDPWGPWIREASARFDVPERWIREVMRQESGGRSSATSRVGAMGLMQVMPGTYRELQQRYGLGNDPYHPYDNLMAGTAYLREMYELYGSPAFLAAYNAGPRRLEDYLWGGKGLPSETRNYVARIGPRIADTSPTRRAAPEVYAAAEIPLNIPPGPRRGDPATMLALREQRRAIDPGIRVAAAPAGPVVRMDPIPDGSTYPSETASTLPQTMPVTPPTQFAASRTVQMEPIASPGDFQVRMEPLPDSAPASQPAGRSALAAAAPPAQPAARPRSGFGLVGSAHAGTLPTPARQTASVASGPGRWGVQVGAFASENLARAAAGQARNQVATLGSRSVVEPVAQGRGKLYRARVVGLASREAAEQACEKLRGKGACMVVAPDA
jgi:soluble lytic murein transglycosylase-like protein/cell division protein FtsN